MAVAPGTPRLLRALNDRAALDLLLQHGSLTRTRLGELTGLSKPTASQLLGRLESAGLVQQAGRAVGTPGPSAQLYALNGRAGLAAGVDVAPFRATAEIVDLAGVSLGSATVDLPRTAAHRRPAQDVATALRAAAAKAGADPHEIRAVVVGAQGAHDPVTDTLAYGGHMPGWSRPGLLASLRAEISAGVQVENDVNLAAVAERSRGLPVPADCFALLWMGDGLGLAVHLGGVLHRGATGGAGEVGYMPVPDLGPVARADALVLQDLIGGPAVLRLARRHGIKAREPELAVERAHRLPQGEGFLVELAGRVALGLATIVAVLDPDLVLVSGPVGRAGGSVLRDLVRTELHRVSPLRPQLAVSDLPGNPVLAGAVALALAQCRDEVFSQVDQPARKRSAEMGRR
jgi:predicted NBD/HSP70 family sugar kinase